MNANKNKGKTYERTVCKIFSDFFGLSFTRIPNSGSFIGGKNFHRAATMSDSQVLLSRGDIIVPDELRRLCIECKSRKGFGFHQLLTEDGSRTMNEWIDQTMVGAEGSDVAISLIVFKPNNCGNFVLFDVKCGLKIPRCHVLYAYRNVEYAVACLNEDFLKLNKEVFLEKCGKNQSNPG